jgi:hypothetical protein
LASEAGVSPRELEALQESVDNPVMSIRTYRCKPN